MALGTTFAGDCAYCGTSTVFEVIAAHIVYSDEGPPFEYSLCKCRQCSDGALFLRENSGGENGFDDDTFARLYPANKRVVVYSLPSVVKASYDEAVKCEAAKAWIACAVMVGRTLEAVAVEYDPKIRTLATALKNMLEAGIISQDIYDWANELRLIRNVGAHAVEGGISAQDAVEALDFAQAILEILYDLRPKFEKMRSRRAPQQIAKSVITGD